MLCTVISCTSSGTRILPESRNLLQYPSTTASTVHSILQSLPRYYFKGLSWCVEDCKESKVSSFPGKHLLCRLTNHVYWTMHIQCPVIMDSLSISKVFVLLTTFLYLFDYLQQTFLLPNQITVCTANTYIGYILLGFKCCKIVQKYLFSLFLHCQNPRYLQIYVPLSENVPLHLRGCTNREVRQRC